jgi:ribosome maturation factor RimP
LGFDLVRVKLFGGADDMTLQVMAERPDTRQLTIDDCAELSRRISDLLDESDPIESGISPRSLVAGDRPAADTTRRFRRLDRT